MRWASALSSKERTGEAIAEAAAIIRRGLAGERADLVIAFASPHHLDAAPRIPALVEEELPGSLLVGCTGSGIIGAGHEVEGASALSLTAASLPGVTLTPFHLDQRELPESADAQEWRETVEVDAEPPPHFLLLADPMTIEAAALVAGLDAAYPRSSKFGGLASGGPVPGANRLFVRARTWRSGAVGVALAGNLTVETIVAQGCRAIGKPMIATRCQRNVLLEVDGRPPLEVLRDLFPTLPARDQELLSHSLFIGIEMRNAVEYREGELLVRNLVGMDAETGAVAVGAPLQPMQVVQFLLRDARTAEEDLTRLLERSAARAQRPAGALLFSCLGRGQHLFGRPDHDTDLFRDKVGAVPLGGFFCNGEIGQVGGSTFLHGYTSSFALFSEARS
ncbi:MAG TPA: FIST N-terminal domain-containing protein [Myxococcales bacterium]|nr:FIST N-terminal domain-containing protein [Myxococcales bacterium]